MPAEKDNSLTPTSAVGYKFTPAGKFLPFRGATIVAPLYPTHPAFTLMGEVKREARQACYSYKYAFLPNSSFHMTVKVLYNDHPKGRAESSWSSFVPNTAPCEMVDRFLYQQLRRIIFPSALRMEVAGMKDSSLQLQPADQDTADKLKRFRDQVAEQTGFRYSDHDSYRYHISYAYRLWQLLPKEQEEQSALMEKQLRRWQQQCPIVDIPRPYFSAFMDMSDFPVYQPKGD